jgi:hypothetical protein
MRRSCPGLASAWASRGCEPDKNGQIATGNAMLYDNLTSTVISRMRLTIDCKRFAKLPSRGFATRRAMDSCHGLGCERSSVAFSRSSAIIQIIESRQRRLTAWVRGLALKPRASGHACAVLELEPLAAIKQTGLPCLRCFVLEGDDAAAAGDKIRLTTWANRSANSSRKPSGWRFSYLYWKSIQTGSLVRRAEVVQMTLEHSQLLIKGASNQPRHKKLLARSNFNNLKVRWR